MKKLKIEKGKFNNGWIGTTSKNTHIPQRQKLEQTIINLATACGCKKILKYNGARGIYYQVIGDFGVLTQSGSNVVLELSKIILKNSNT